MRLIEYPLTSKDKHLIDQSIGAVSDFEWLVPRDVAEDMVSILYTNPEKYGRYIIPAEKLYHAAAEEYAKVEDECFFDLVHDLFSARSEITAFSSSEIVKEIFRNPLLSHGEKVLAIIQGLAQTIKRMKELKEQMQSEKGASPIPGMPQPQKESMTSPYKMFGDIFDIVVPPDSEDGEGTEGTKGEDEKEGEEKEQESKGKKSAIGPGRFHFHKINKQKQTMIAEIFKKFRPETQKIFQLAKNFSWSFKRKDGTIYRDAIIGNSFYFRKMRKYEEMKWLKTSDKALDDEIFDIRLMKKDFLIQHPREKYEKSQYIYVLADISGSMSEVYREVFMKAILIALGKHALATKSRLHFRFFSSSLFGLCKLEKANDWQRFLERVLGVNPNGGTHINLALETALADIVSNYPHLKEEDEVELVMITDGTQDVNAESMSYLYKNQELILGKEIKRHMIILEPVQEDNILATYTAFFHTVNQNSCVTLTEVIQKGMEFIEII